MDIFNKWGYWHFTPNYLSQPYYYLCFSIFLLFNFILLSNFIFVIFRPEAHEHCWRPWCPFLNKWTSSATDDASTARHPCVFIAVWPSYATTYVNNAHLSPACLFKCNMSKYKLTYLLGLHTWGRDRRSPSEVPRPPPRSLSPSCRTVTASEEALQTHTRSGKVCSKLQVIVL